MINIAFPLIGGGGWIGGINYLTNTLRILRDFLPNEIAAHVVLTPDQAARHADELSNIVDDRVIVDDVFARCRGGSSLGRSIVSSSYGPIMAPLRSAGIDVMFENSAFFGWNPEVPCLTWIPDFQHRHLRHLFSKSAFIKREIGFRAQIAARRTIMLSSKSALKDLSRFYGKHDAQVVRFAVYTETGRILDGAHTVAQEYDLPDTFFYLPNQFWVHKNHRLLVRALQILKDDGRLPAIPPIALSGHTVDARAPEHFGEMMKQVSALGLESHFRYLGVLPYEDVLRLNAACLALINPSMFEGWSTTIEEAKALSTPLLLSALDIHREQAPGARFFGVDSPADLAEALWETAQGQVPKRPEAAQIQADQMARLNEHAWSLRNAIETAARR